MTTGALISPRIVVAASEPRAPNKFLLLSITAFIFLFQEFTAFAGAVEQDTSGQDHLQADRMAQAKDDGTSSDVDAPAEILPATQDELQAEKDKDDQTQTTPVVSSSTASSSEDVPAGAAAVDHTKQVDPSSSSFLFFSSQNGQEKSKKFLERRENDSPASMFQLALDFAGMVTGGAEVDARGTTTSSSGTGTSKTAAAPVDGAESTFVQEHEKLAVGQTEKQEVSKADGQMQGGPAAAPAQQVQDPQQQQVQPPAGAAQQQQQLPDGQQQPQQAAGTPTTQTSIFGANANQAKDMADGVNGMAQQSMIIFFVLFGVGVVGIAVAGVLVYCYCFRATSTTSDGDRNSAPGGLSAADQHALVRDRQQGQGAAYYDQQQGAAAAYGGLYGQGAAYGYDQGAAAAYGYNQQAAAYGYNQGAAAYGYGAAQ
ncbi:unnamed protein product [Amoebophrya sp. A120]|nr:unnamed protein product [Amoebophrya sp. A120]|eukprot:GSA120T00025199001.1